MPLWFDEPTRRWVLQGRESTYAFGVDAGGTVQHLYFGRRLARPAQDLPADLGWQPEYPGWSGLYYAEPCLKVTFADHVRHTPLRYERHVVEGSHVVVTLRDAHYPLRVHLHYRGFEEHDLVERYAVVENAGSTPVTLEQVLSASWYLERGRDYVLTHLAGAWGAEFQVYRQAITPGKKLLESRRGHTSHLANPWFAIDPGTTTEDEGAVWFGALGWSGNWKIAIDHTPGGHLQISGGIHDFDFAWHLSGGTSFQTPSFVAGYTDQGFGQASRNLHRYQRQHILPRPAAEASRPVLYNSWEATGFHVTEENQLGLAERAAAVGTELLVVDDGWFGARDDDHAGLGDWVINRQKFPRGLQPLIQRVHALGMEFGLWVEPEMVNPDSELYRAHPDWVYHFPNRARSESRNQLVLNLAQPEVQAHLFAALDRLLTDNAIAFLKWDLNRPVSEPGWPAAPPQAQREVWVRHVLALYDLLQRLRTKHPGITLESCASGGGRVDLGILRLVDQVWTSDNTDPVDRLRIQEGYSMAYCPQTMMCWVTDSGRRVDDESRMVAFRFHSAMMGSLGIGANLLEWSTEALAEARRWVQEYKAIRPIVQKGDQYRLLSPRAGDTTAVEYVSEDRSQGVLFVLHHAESPRPQTLPIHLRGLKEEGRYRVTGLAAPLPGAALMQGSLEVQLDGALASRLIRIQETPSP